MILFLRISYAFVAKQLYDFWPIFYYCKNQTLNTADSINDTIRDGYVFCYTQINIFEILLNQTEIRLYLLYAPIDSEQQTDIR